MSERYVTLDRDDLIRRCEELEAKVRRLGEINDELWAGRAVQDDGLPTDARNALADATWLDREGVNIEHAVKRLHRFGYTVVRRASESGQPPEASDE